MKRKSKSAKNAGSAKAPASAMRPLGALHRDYGWTPEQLQAEIEAEGLDYAEEVTKQRALVASLAAKHAAGINLGDPSNTRAAAPAGEERSKR